MSQNYQQTARRKENISAIEPLISAMRTISLSQWRMALNRQENLASFLEGLAQANAILHANTNDIYTQDQGDETVLIALGSNRGLCGNFNKHVLRFARAEGITQKQFTRIYLAGKKLPSLFNDMAHWHTETLDFPDITAIPQAASLFSLATLTQLEGKTITMLFNRYQGAGRFETVCEQIYPLPPEKGADSRSEALEAIIDTDAHAMARRLQQLSFSTQLQACLYSSMASEHSARFALMENADQNIEKLAEELEVLLQDYRKGKITAETQELAVSSGLLD